MPQPIAREVVASKPIGKDPFSMLTAREWSILQLISEGCTNVQIGSHLNISRYTVAQHITKIFRRTGAINRADLVNRALKSGALPVNAE